MIWSEMAFDGKPEPYAHAIVVLILPTFVSSDILASSTANIGVSTILILQDLRALARLIQRVHVEVAEM